MAIATVTPKHHQNPDNPIPTVHRRELRDNIVDGDETPISSLLTHLEGTDWSVDYFHALVGEHTDLTQIDVSTPESHQTYELIKDLPLKVQTSLSFNYDESNTIGDVTGDALVTSFIVPNKGDAFIAQAGSYKLALFQIKSVSRLTYNRQSVYRVSYQLASVDDEARVTLNSMYSRTPRTFNFSKAKLGDGLDPILTTEENTHYLRLERVLKTYVERYLNSYFIHGIDVLLIPDQTTRIYDHELAQFAHTVLSFSEHMSYGYGGQLTHAQPTQHFVTLYEMLLQRDPTAFSICKFKREALSLNNTVPGTVNTSVLTHLSLLNLDYAVVIPDEKPYDRDAHIGDLTTVELDEVLKVNGIGFLTSKTHEVDGVDMPLYPTLSIFDSYILPEDFYVSQTVSSVLERNLLRAIRRDSLHPDELYQLLVHVNELPSVAQFYFLPLIGYLIRVYLTQ